MTVAELDRRMSSDEFTHWNAFFKIENEEMESKRKTPKSDPDID